MSFFFNPCFGVSKEEEFSFSERKRVIVRLQVLRRGFPADSNGRFLCIRRKTVDTWAPLGTSGHLWAPGNFKLRRVVPCQEFLEIDEMVALNQLNMEDAKEEKNH